MGEPLLGAECVIRLLCEKRVIEPLAWKRPHAANNSYPVTFSRAGSNGVVILDIEVSEGIYYVSRSRVKIIACRYRFDAGDIYASCAV